MLKKLGLFAVDFDASDDFSSSDLLSDDNSNNKSDNFLSRIVQISRDPEPTPLDRWPLSGGNLSYSINSHMIFGSWGVHRSGAMDISLLFKKRSQLTSLSFYTFIFILFVWYFFKV